MKKWFLGLLLVFVALPAYADTCVVLGDSTSLDRTTPSVVTPSQTFPSLIGASTGCTMMNKGLSNDNTVGGRSRFETDVTAYSPNYLAINYITNDAACGQVYAVSITNFEENIRWMIERAHAIGVKRVALFTGYASTDSNVKSCVTPYLAVLRKMPSIYAYVNVVDTGALFAEYGHKNGGMTGVLMDHWHPNVTGSSLAADAALLPQNVIAFGRGSGSCEPEDDEWLTVAGPITISGESANWANYTILQVVDASEISNTGLSDFRATFKSGTSEGFLVSSASVCEGASTGNVYNCASTPTPLTIAGTSSPNTEFTGTATFSVPTGKRVVIALRGTTSAHDAGAKNTVKSNWQAYWRSGDEVMIPNRTNGYSTGNKVDLVVKLEAR